MHHQNQSFPERFFWSPQILLPQVMDEHPQEIRPPSALFHALREHCDLNLHRRRPWHRI
ncbi:hypothetical protein KSP39_PZI012066 [Platanthera zijinensis]|uniref:Uncharacterized protein n=1 Tax=Platanthera zijinensis TaxID=2320716 RepID=A0AAP0G522_9ASPA